MKKLALITAMVLTLTDATIGAVSANAATLDSNNKYVISVSSSSTVRQGIVNRKTRAYWNPDSSTGINYYFRAGETIPLYSNAASFGGGFYQTKAYTSNGTITCYVKKSAITVAGIY